MRIQHNIAALNSYRNLTNNNSAVSKNLEKLSSGYKINRAGDDAAGLAISEKMRAQITGLETAQKNANDGISLVQTAEGALTEVHSMLNRMVELANQSANGTYDDADRAQLQKEIVSLKDEIDRISEGTNFNGINLLDGSMGGGTAGAAVEVNADTTREVKAFNFEISGADEDVSVKFEAVNGADNANVGVKASWNGKELVLSIQSNSTGSNKITQEDINQAIRDASGAPEAGKGINVKIDRDIEFSNTSVTGNVTGATGTIKAAKYATAVGTSVTNTAGVSTKVVVTSTKAGNIQSGLTVSITPTSEVKATTAANGDVTLNLAADNEYTAAEINQMLSEAGANMTVSYEGALKGSALFAGSSNANTALYKLGNDNGSTLGAGLASGGGLTLQIGDTAESFNQLTVKVGNMSSTSLGIGAIDISTQAGAKSAVALIKNAINSVSSTRGDLGAIQNRLEHTINNLSVTTENMTAAESRIRDVDMANEMMAYTKNNILVQSSQAMLAQANQIPQGVLQLLQ